MALPLLLLALLFGGVWAWAPDLDRAELEARHGGPPSEFVIVDGLRLHLRDSAPGGTPDSRPAVVLLHGFGSSLHSWDGWAGALAQQHRVLRIDLPGAALTGPDPSGDYSDERAVRLLVALLDARGIARAHFVGHSMGGRIAWRFAAAQPARVQRLVLIAPDGFPSPGFELGKPPELPVAARLLPHALPRAAVRAALSAAWGDALRLDEETVTRYHELLRAPGVRDAMLARLGQMVPADPVPLLRQIAAPILLLWGGEDRLIPPAHAVDYLRALPDARAVVLPGLGHVPQEEDAAGSLGPVLDFLAG